MEIKKFIENYREAFGEYAELPILFWYSDILENETEKVNGCFFKSIDKVREGNTISLNAETIGAVAVSFIPDSLTCPNVSRHLYL